MDGKGGIDYTRQARKLFIKAAESVNPVVITIWDTSILWDWASKR